MDSNKHSTPLGLRLCQIAIPALAIPSAIGVAKFFSIADRVDGWTAQGVIAAAGFELTNVGMSILDVRRPELHQVAQRVRFWSVAAAIAMNVISHYAVAVPGLDQVDGVAALLALVASVPLALLYVKLAAFLHAMAESDHAERDMLAGLRAELAKARDELAAKVGELAAAAARLATVETMLATTQSEARDAATQAREMHAAKFARVEAEAREARATLATTEATLTAQIKEARDAAREAERGRAQAQHDADQLRAELGRLRDRSREALMREAQTLQAAHGWGASEIAKSLGWPESTVRGWIGTSTPAAAAAAG